MKLTRRRWTRLTLLLLLFSLGGIIVLVAAVDPFEVYHRATAFIAPITNGTQSYSNAGIAKNYDYDSVIIGSSMTENFVPSQLDTLFGGSFIKLCINGGSPYNHRQMMSMAFRTHNVRRVLYGIDVDALTYFYKLQSFEMPEYLYDDDLTNDVRYWFNTSVLSKYIPECLETLGESDPDQRDEMYSWGDLYPYGAQYALRNTTVDHQTFDQKEKPELYVMSQQTMLNIEHNYVPFIEKHPDTEFVFFFPPYSLVRWYNFYRGQVLDYHLSQCSAVAARLLQYPNVKIYDFRSRTDWILNLDNYIDDYHYGPWINSAMAESMAAEEARITDASEIEANSAVIRDLVSQVVSAGEWPSSFILPSENN